MTAVRARSIKFISHCDQGGRGDGVQIMVHRGYAYIGHGFSNGITVVDVRDPKRPKTVNFLPCPPNTRALHLQTHDDLLLAVNAPSMWTMQVSEKAYFSGSPANLLQGQERTFTSGMRVYDISQPATPREIAFMPVVDMAEPTRPVIAGKWWLPGMWSGGGETPTWPSGRRFALHHALVAGNLAYGAWRDGGLTVLDVANPTQPTLLSHRNLDPPFGGGTHSPLPLPERNLLVLADEPNFANCSQGLRYIWVFDVRAPTNPVSIATLPIPADDDYCAKGGNFGAHNLWENRPGGFQARASSLRRITMPVFELTISTIPSSRARSAITCRQTPSACTIRARIDRKSSNRTTASSTRRA